MGFSNIDGISWARPASRGREIWGGRTDSNRHIPLHRRATLTVMLTTTTERPATVVAGSMFSCYGVASSWSGAATPFRRKGQIGTAAPSITEPPLEPRRGVLAVQDENREPLDAQLDDRQHQRRRAAAAGRCDHPDAAQKGHARRQPQPPAQAQPAARGARYAGPDHQQQ